MNKDDPMIIRATHGVTREKRTDIGYNWNSANRGGDPCVILQLTLAGWGVLENRQGKFPVGPGKALLTFVPENARYYYPTEAREPWVFTWLNFEGELGLFLWRALRDEFGAVLDFPPSSPATRAFLQLVKKIESRSFHDSLEESELSYRFLLLCRQEQQKRGAPVHSSIREVVDFFRQRSHEAITVKEMADRAGLSREYFTRSFLKETGLSPAAYLRNLRIDRAGALLKRTDMPVAEIAESCGFASARQFSKTFRRFRGTSPLEFRQT